MLRHTMQNFSTQRGPLGYLPDDSEAEQQNNFPPNNSPGSDASRKAWETAKARAVEAYKKTPYDLRQQVCLCNDAKLTDFAKLLFCRLTDMAFKPEFRRGEGIIACSKRFLAEDFACCEDTIRRATRGLELTGFLWTKTFWNGSFEITWWFIREWADDTKEYDPHTGSNFGSRVRRVQRNTVRGERGKFAPNPDSQRQKILRLLGANGNGATVKAEISGVHGDKSAVSALNLSPGQGAVVSPVTAHESALTALTFQRCHGALVSADTADPSALTWCSSQPCHGGPVPGLSTLKTITVEVDKEPFKRSTGLTAQKAGRGKPKSTAENVFLLDVGAMMEKWKKGSSKAELSGSGVWWRLAYRADAELMRKVLADVLGMVKESKIKVTPGKTAVDLWKRWGGSLPTDSRQEPATEATR